MKLVRLSQKGLVGNWRFDNPSDLGRDYSPKGNNGTLYGPTMVDGHKFGKALSFDGSSDYVDIGNSPSLKASTAITISIWVYKTGGSGNPVILMKGSNDYDLYTQSTNIIWYVTNASGDGFYKKYSGLSFNTWHYVVAYYKNDGTMGCYIDGSPATLTGESGTPGGDIRQTNDIATIGSWYTGTANFIAGTIDEVMVFNRVLSAQEIKVLYALGKHPRAVKPMLKVM